MKKSTLMLPDRDPQAQLRSRRHLSPRPLFYSFAAARTLTQWTWVWVDSRNWWWTGRPGVLRFTGSPRVRHDWATELSWADLKKSEKRKADLISTGSFLSVNPLRVLPPSEELCCVPDSSWCHGHMTPCPRDSPGKNTGGGCRFLLQGIFPTLD